MTVLKRLLLAALLTLGATAAQAAPRLVILVSIDAFRADYFARGNTPTLAMLAKTGVRAMAMHPSFPSLTYPNHYTLVTGLRPDHHGMINNNMTDASVSAVKFSMESKVAEDPRWWEGATPLWVTAQKSGRIVASAGWPGSEGLIHGSRANYLDPWRKDRDPMEIAGVALNWLDLPPKLRPSLEFLYFEEVDHAGHDFGPDSPQVNDAMHQVDAALAALVAGLKKRHLYSQTDIVLVSDHGMANTSNDRVIVLDDLVPKDSATLAAYGTVAGLDPVPGHEDELAKALVGRHAHASCWRKADIPAQFHYGTNPRVPAIVCLADEGWMLEPKAEIAKWTKAHPGSHGFDPALPSMQALFLAHGPDFRKGVTLAPIDNVDVYPMLATITGLAPEKNDGDPAVLAAALSQPPAK